MAKPAEVSAESPALEVRTPPKEEAKNPLAGPVTWVDDRVGLAKVVGNIRKVFPEHWSFLLGEIALYSFIILLLTGVFLTIWFK
ncbi:MAG TPA: ubiquinol-cytochrome c reductase cytochrome b subunit, partial [Propionicimonas sp.]|nr:ubiquinol-cytochrome c reductase cytochrome b subunit [Propionicimonas sp.]